LKWFFLLKTLSFSRNSWYARHRIKLYRFISLSDFISWNNIEKNLKLRYPLVMNFLFIIILLVLTLLYGLNHFLLLKSLLIEHLMLAGFLPVWHLKIRIRIYIVFEHLFLLVNFYFINLAYLISTQVKIKLGFHALFKSVA
jgi:hypothetical protein